MGMKSELAGCLSASLVLWSSVSLAAPPALATKPVDAKAAPGKFIRVQRDEKKQPTALETAIVRYVPASGEGNLTVDLIGAVHVGDRGYYQKLNDQFEQYDVLLYELVAPPGTRIPKGGKRKQDNPLAIMQKVMTLVLQLDSQTERIDYTKKNFVHADLSFEQMGEAIRKRGDDGLTLGLSIAADMLRQNNLRESEQRKNPEANTDLDISALLTDPEAALKLKRLLAEQFMTGDGGLGKTLDTILIVDRNKAALKVFQKELTKGKKKIGIFYGAAHLPDFDQRLREEFGLKRASERWLTAWDLTKSKEFGLEDLLDLLK